MALVRWLLGPVVAAAMLGAVASVNECRAEHFRDTNFVEINESRLCRVDCTDSVVTAQDGGFPSQKVSEPSDVNVVRPLEPIGNTTNNRREKGFHFAFYVRQKFVRCRFSLLAFDQIVGSCDPLLNEQQMLFFGNPDGVASEICFRWKYRSQTQSITAVFYRFHRQVQKPFCAGILSIGERVIGCNSLDDRWISLRGRGVSNVFYIHLYTDEHLGVDNLYADEVRVGNLNPRPAAGNQGVLSDVSLPVGLKSRALGRDSAFITEPSRASRQNYDGERESGVDEDRNRGSSVPSAVLFILSALLFCSGILASLKALNRDCDALLIISWLASASGAGLAAYAWIATF
jgi:hypothetical protein